MLRHKRQIWRRLSARIKRQESNPEERPALTAPKQDKAAGYYNWQRDPRGQKDGDHCVENGEHCG